MTRTKDIKGRSPTKTTDAAPGAHKKATYTLPPDALNAVDANWRFHETLDSRLADSKSAYVADLIRRDATTKSAGKKTSRRGE